MEACQTNQKHAVPLYDLEDATLNGISGRGYAFAVDTFRGKEYKGVFFATEDDVPNLDTDAETVSFEGRVYHKTTQREDSFTVNVTDVTPVGVGARIAFEVID